MTDEQKVIVRRLRRCTFPVASCDKRFVRNMAGVLDVQPERELTERQAAYLLRLDHRYRRQTGIHVCTPLCANLGRRQAGECFDAEVVTPTHFTRTDQAFLRSMGIAPMPHAPLPLFDDIARSETTHG